MIICSFLLNLDIDIKIHKASNRSKEQRRQNKQQTNQRFYFFWPIQTDRRFTFRSLHVYIYFFLLWIWIGSTWARKNYNLILTQRGKIRRVGNFQFILWPLLVYYSALPCTSQLFLDNVSFRKNVLDTTRPRVLFFFLMLNEIVGLMKS